MKITVCELSDDQASLETEWSGLAAHVAAARSDLVLLPEMPFHSWWMSTASTDNSVWAAAVASHENWKGRLPKLQAKCTLGSFPVLRKDERINEGFIFENNRYIAAHEKHFLPNEAGFWEATWCSRGNGKFLVANAGTLSVGFLICTELWSIESARVYGKAGAHLVASPRSSLLETRDKWHVAGRAAAIVGGVFSVSSNRRGTSPDGIEFGGEGWIIDPDGKILGMTSRDEPFLTIDIDIAHAVRAKGTYPRDVFM
jgi:N-carbamoylputrescine amidase